VVGNDEEPRKQRKSLDNGNEEIAMKPTQKSAKNIQTGQAGRFESKKENDAEDKPDNDKKKAPEGGKAITRANPGHR